MKVTVCVTDVHHASLFCMPAMCLIKCNGAPNQYRPYQISQWAGMTQCTSLASVPQHIFQTHK